MHSYYKRILTIIALLLISIIALELWTRPTFSQTGSVKIWDRNHTLLYESAGTAGSHHSIPFDEIPQYLVDATIASEDKTFWTNPGIDPAALARAVFQNINNRRIVSGASTITQQLARIGVISPHANPKRSYVRKVREIIMAVRINASYTKKEIITMYLNRVYYGNLSYGIEAASRQYFDKNASKLSLAESALLTGIIASPETRNPFTNKSDAKAHQRRVLSAMTHLEMISQDQANAAAAEEIVFAKPQTIIKAPHFVHYVLDEFRGLDIPKNTDIHVKTTLDYPTYVRSQEIASLWIDRLRSLHDVSNAALVLLKNDTGEIVSMLGGIDYFDASRSGQVNLAIASRQPGSTLKPITYAAAFERGFTPASLIYDVKTIYKTKKGEGYAPNNYDGKFHGLVLAREALASSYNLPAVEMLRRIGIAEFVNTARDMGISTFTDPARYDLSITLGGGEVTLLDLTNVYATFAREGVFQPYHAIDTITDEHNNTIYKHQSAPGKPVFGAKSSQISYVISDILSDEKARIPGFGEKNPLVLSRPAAVKTGTTTDWHDNWTVGYTSSYTVGVWVGNNDNRAMRHITGVVGAAPIWNQFFESYLKGKPVESFEKPKGMKAVEICKTDGLLPGDACPVRMTELFIEGTEPIKISKLYKKITVDKRNGLRASATCPAEFTDEKTRIEYPPEVYSWAVSNNQPLIPSEYSPLCDGADDTQISGSSIQIIYPKDNAVFMQAPDSIAHRAIVFEVATPPGVTSVTWTVDGHAIGTTSTFPFSISWAPQNGHHTIGATATTNGKTSSSQSVTITVEDYKKTL